MYGVYVLLVLVVMSSGLLFKTTPRDSVSTVNALYYHPEKWALETGAFARDPRFPHLGLALQCAGLVSPHHSNIDLSELPAFLLRRLSSFLLGQVSLTSHVNRPSRSCPIPRPPPLYCTVWLCSMATYRTYDTRVCIRNMTQ